MRLIDADKIRYTSLEDGFGRIKESIAFATDIEKQPTVEAIPIEWIEAWLWDNQDLFKPNGMANIVIANMLKDWEKGNG